MNDSVPFLSNEQLLEIFSLTKTATAIHVTEDAIIQTANDAMLRIWDKDKSIIGKSLEDALPELKGQPFIDLFKRVWNEGITIEGTDTRADLKVNGVLQPFYFDFEYRAIKDTQGKTICILHTATDITDRFLKNEAIERAREKEIAFLREQALNEELAAANEELNAINEELTQTEEHLSKLNNELEERVNQRTQALAESVEREQAINEEITAINEEMTAANEELIATNEELAKTQESLLKKVEEQLKGSSELKKAEEMMRLAIEASKLGSWHISPGSMILEYNPMLAKLFGYEGEQNMTYQQAIGQVTEDYRPIVTSEIEQAIASGGDYDITYSQRRFNDGELIWLRSLGKVTADNNGNFTTFSGFVMDITELKKDEQRKNDFIGMVSHELKTPLTSLSGYIQMLQSKAKKTDDNFTIGALEIAHKQVKKMTTMINGFLNISRLESGKIILTKSYFRLDELVKATVEEILMMDSSHAINFIVCEPINIFADDDKISNVISNLLSNAVKYAPNDKQIEIRCEVINNMAQISVSDKGMGIKEEDMQKLFERYYRVENNHTISGFGIGLYLSAEIIERHHGMIWAKSEVDKGSTFYFKLPLA